MTVGNVYGPEIGLILSSLARSLLASSHSLVIVLGGGGAVTGFFFLRKEKFDVIVDWQKRERTDSAETGVEQTRGANEGRNASEDLDGRTGGVNRRTRAMRTKRNIVSYNEAHQCTIRRDPKKTRHSRTYQPSSPQAKASSSPSAGVPPVAGGRPSARKD